MMAEIKRDPELKPARVFIEMAGDPELSIHHGSRRPRLSEEQLL
jgi:hypothetical protein